MNRCRRICSPLPRLSANPPRGSLHVRARAGARDPLRADDGIRTRDPHLGKVMLYQLSHVRTPSREAPFRCMDHHSRPIAAAQNRFEGFWDWRLVNPSAKVVPRRGDWRSGSALRSHRRGHWFEPSIAHPDSTPHQSFGTPPRVLSAGARTPRLLRWHRTAVGLPPAALRRPIQPGIPAA